MKIISFKTKIHSINNKNKMSKVQNIKPKTKVSKAVIKFDGCDPDSSENITEQKPKKLTKKIIIKSLQQKNKLK